MPEERSRSIRILHLEDQPKDAILVRAALEAEALTFELEHVDSRHSFVEAVERAQFDLILSDYALPQFDGLTAMEIARRRFPHVPFIFVSGTLGEDAAIAAVRA